MTGNSAPGYLSRDIENNLFINIYVPLCSLSISHNSEDMKTTQCPLMDDWIKSGTYIQWNSTQPQNRKKYGHL